MALIPLVVVLIIVGVLLWLLNAIVPMEPWVKTVINVVVALCVFIWLLQAFGLISGFHHIRLQ